MLLRTIDDYRYGKGACLEANTFRLEINDTSEFGSVKHFLAEADVPEAFSLFSSVQFQKAETTFQQRQEVNSDWLIMVR